MVAVTFALPAESSAFVRLLQDAQHEREVVQGHLERRSSSNSNLSRMPVAVIHTGVGAAKCAERLAKFLGREKPQWVVSSGFCGATRDELKPGDLFIAENFSSPELVQQAHQTLSRAAKGTLHSSDAVVHSAAERYEIAARHSADAIDMETATIARLCDARAVPLLALRVVSDSPAAPFPAPPHALFDIEEQRANVSGLLKYLARNPAGIARFALFSKQIAIARTELADALAAVLEDMSPVIG